MKLGAAPVAFAVVVFVIAIGNIVAAGIGAMVIGLHEMMVCICFVSAHIADAVVHTGMLAPFVILTVGAVPGMTVLVVSIRSVGMFAVKASPSADGAYIPLSYMGFHSGQFSPTDIAQFDVTLTSGRVVLCIFMFAMIWIDIAADACVSGGVKGVRFTRGNFRFAVHAPFGMPIDTT